MKFHSIGKKYVTREMKEIYIKCAFLWKKQLVFVVLRNINISLSLKKNRGR